MGKHHTPEDLVARLRARGNGDIADGYEDKTERGQLDLEAANEIERLRAHISRRRDTLSAELHIALEEWKDASAPTERVVTAIGNLVQQGIDYVIAEFDEAEKS